MIPTIDTNAAAFAPTRSWLQDVAKVMGKFQQVFLPPHALDWQTGLHATPGGLMTRQFQFKGQNHSMLFEVATAELTFAQERWSLKDHTAQQLFDTLNAWLKAQQQPAMAQPELGNQTAPDEAMAKDIVNLLTWAAEALERRRPQLPLHDCGPVLLYPHHFDESFSWYPNGLEGAKNTDDQRGYGFSLGDDDIPAPYFYITAYPEPPDFTAHILPPEAHWQTKGFRGAVLPYAALTTAANASALVQSFLQAVR